MREAGLSTITKPPIFITISPQTNAKQHPHPLKRHHLQRSGHVSPQQHPYYSSYVLPHARQREHHQNQIATNNTQKSPKQGRQQNPRTNRRNQKYHTYYIPYHNNDGLHLNLPLQAPLPFKHQPTLPRDD